MSYQVLPNCMEVPVAPEQTGGWSTPYVFHGQNLSWTVTTKRGSIGLRIEKLSQEDVRNFDANKYAARPR
jgi:hypothetical protein